MQFHDSNTINFVEWDSFVNKSAYGSPFQTPAFYTFINGLSGFKAEVFAVSESDSLQALVLVVIARENGLGGFFSRRGIIYGGPVVRINNEAVISFLLQHTVKALEGKVIYLEVRNFFEYQFCHSVYENSGWEYQPYLNYQIAIHGKSTDDLLSVMKYNRRREIKLSIKNGATFELASNYHEVKQVYSILKTLYRERVKLPLPGFDFFKAFMDTDIARVFVIKYENQIIAGSFCLFYPHKSIYTMYYCGLREINKKIFPTSLAVYAALDFAVKENIPVVDLMGAGQSGEKYGVRNYKSQFGGVLVEHGRYIKVLNPLLYTLGKIGISLMAKLQ